MLKFDALLLLFLAGYCLVISFSFIVGPIPYGYDQTRLLEVVFLFVLSVACFFSKTEFLKISTPVTAFTVIVFVAGMVSSVLAAKPVYAFLEISTYLVIFLGTWFLASAINSREKINAFIILYSGFTLLFALMFLTVVLSGYLAGLISGFPLVWYELINGFSNVRFFNQYQIWTLPIITYAVLSVRSDHHLVYRLVFAILISWWFLLFLSETRGGLLAVFSSFMIAALIFKHHVYKILKVNLFSAVSGWLVYKFLFLIVPVIFAKDRALDMVVQVGFIDRVGGLTRMDMWSACIEYITKSPWFGIGPMHLAYVPNNIAAHPHNSILQWSAEWGLISFSAAFIVMLIAGYRWCSKFNYKTMGSYDENMQNTVMCLFLAATGSLAYSLLDGVFVTPVSQLCLLITVGLMSSVYANFNVPVNNEFLKNPVLKIFFLITSTIMIFCVISSNLTAVLYSPEAMLDNIKTYGPRFWQIGGIPHS